MREEPARIVEQGQRIQVAGDAQGALCAGGPAREAYQWAGERFTVAGRVCMDQVVVDLGDLAVAVGDEAVLFGAGGPSADDVAASCGTIGYEIVTRIGPRVPRVHREVTT